MVGPLHEEDTILAVTGEFVWVHRVEFDPVGRADCLVIELHADLRAILVLICPVPEGARLGLIGSQGRDVAAVS